MHEFENLLQKRSEFKCCIVGNSCSNVCCFCDCFGYSKCEFNSEAKI